MTFHLSAAATAVWFCFMTYLSHQNGEQTSQTSRELTEQIERIFPAGDFAHLHGLLRQAAHVVVFMVLAILLLTTISMKSHDVHIMLAAVAGIAVWAWVDEATKPWIQGRHFSWYDVRLNLLGVLIGTLIFVVCRMVLM